MTGGCDADKAEIVRLRRRGEFLAAARGLKAPRRPFVVQAVRRPDASERRIGVGLTVTRKIGSAVVRNRVRRRLREVLARSVPGNTVVGCNYVIVARPPALWWPFTDLIGEAKDAFVSLATRLEPAEP